MKTKPIYISYAGPTLLDTPLLNKGSAFSKQERQSFNLIGLLPPRYESIDEQVERAYIQYCNIEGSLNRHIYLRDVQDSNETLFYRLITDHLVEMLPVIYTPTVGEACEYFSDIYRSPRGIIVSFEERDLMEDILRSATKDNVKVIVVTDGGRVLGLGDQGIGGMGIAIGKLSIYSACGGISPAYTLPITLDVGTNNEKLLQDPLYMGLRQRRVGKADYDDFVDQFLTAAQARWPGVLIQFEDFAQDNAMPILQRHRDHLCCFNDDIQGTAAITLGTLLAACGKKGESLSEQVLVFVGSGSAGCGIAELIIRAMIDEGLTDTEARDRILMVDRFGLLMNNMSDLRNFQQRLTKSPDSIRTWRLEAQAGSPTLQDVVNNAAATVLIGVSGKPGLFTEAVIRQLHADCAVPIILPLSNPSHHVEATPSDVLAWTNGEAIVATGSPFEDVTLQGSNFPISQCNNSYVFPGIGLGVIACKARLVSDEMLMVASRTIAALAIAAQDQSNTLLPPLSMLSSISKKIAFEVGITAQAQGLAPKMTDEELRESIDRNFWIPAYREYRRIAMRAH